MNHGLGTRQPCGLRDEVPSGVGTVISLPASSALLVKEGYLYGMGLAMGIFNGAMNLGTVLAPLAGGLARCLKQEAARKSEQTSPFTQASIIMSFIFTFIATAPLFTANPNQAK